MKRLAVWIAGMTMIGPSEAQSIDCVDYRDFSSWVSRIDLPGDFEESVIADDLLYVAAKGGGVRTFDISNPGTIEVFGGTPTFESAYDLALLDDLMFVADGASGLTIFLLERPLAPQPIGSTSTPGNAVGIALRIPSAPGVSNAFLACGAAGLVVVNYDDPSSPVVIGSLDTPGNATDVFVFGDVAYVADGANGLLVVDVSTPEAPVVLGEALGSSITDIAFAGGFVYTAGALSTMAIDVSNPESPMVVDSEPVPNGNDVCVDGDRVFVVNDVEACLFDRAQPGNLFEVGRIRRGPPEGKGIVARGSDLFVSAGTRGLELLRVADQFDPPPTYSIDPGEVQGAFLEESRLVIQDSSKFKIYDVTAPDEPVLLLSFDPPQVLLHAADVQGHLLHALTGLLDSYYRIFDVSDPSQITSVGTVHLGVESTAARDVDVQGTLSFVCDVSGLYVVDLTDLHSPNRVGFSLFGADGSGAGVAYSSELAFVALTTTTSTLRLRIFDVSNPETPLALSTTSFNVPVPTAEHADVEVFGNYVWYSTGTQLSPVFDVSDPVHPINVGNIPSNGYAWRVEKEENLAYISDNGLTVVDVSDPAHPVVLGSLPGSDPYVMSSVSGRAVAVARTEGVWITSAQCPAVTAADEIGSVVGSTMLTVAPNPTRAGASVAFALPRAGDVELSIHDLAGRRVRTLLRGRQDGGRSESAWDARDEQGSSVVSGVYFVRLQVDGRSVETDRIVLVR